MSANPLIDPNLMRALSTNVDVNYLRGKFLGVTGNRLREQLDLSQEPDHRFNNDWIDPLHPIVRRLRNLDKKDMRPVIYNGQKLTTLSHQIYGNSTLWYVPLYVSGYCHPHEIPHGSVLFFPSMQVLSELMKTTAKSKRGSIVKA